jgi:hypothetical protein
MRLRGLLLKATLKALDELGYFLVGGTEELIKSFIKGIPG